MPYYKRENNNIFKATIFFSFKMNTASEQELTLEDVLQYWTNAEFKDITTELLEPLLAEVNSDDQKQNPELEQLLMFYLRGAGKLPRNAYNEIAALEKAVDIFEKTIPEQKRTAYLFGKFYYAQVLENFLDGVCQLKDCKLVKNLQSMAAIIKDNKDNNADSLKYKILIDKLNKYVMQLRDGYGQIVRAAQALATTESADLRTALKDNRFRDRIYLAAFDTFKNALEFETAKNEFYSNLFGLSDRALTDAQIELNRRIQTYNESKARMRFLNK